MIELVEFIEGCSLSLVIIFVMHIIVIGPN